MGARLRLSGPFAVTGQGSTRLRGRKVGRRRGGVEMVNHVCVFLSCVLAGQVVSTKKEELVAILDHCNIQVCLSAFSGTYSCHPLSHSLSDRQSCVPLEPGHKPQFPAFLQPRCKVQGRGFIRLLPLSFPLYIDKSIHNIFGYASSLPPSLTFFAPSSSS